YADCRPNPLFIRPGAAPPVSAAPSTDIKSNRSSAVAEAVRTLFPGYFALVMATGIVSIAASLQGWMIIAWPLFFLNCVFYVVLWAMTAARLFWYRDNVIADLTSHANGAAFLTTVAGTCVLGTQYELMAVSTNVAMGLWILGAALWVLLIYTFFASVSIRPSKPMLEEGLSGSWLLTVVSTQSVSVLGTLLAPHFGSSTAAALFAMLCMYLLGCMLYLLIIALIFYRIIFLTLTPKDLTPPYWINMGAVAITTLAGVRLLLRTGDWTLLAEARPF